MEKFKSFYNKEYLDYSNGLVDPLQFHSGLKFVMKSFSVTYGGRPPIWSAYFFSFVVANIFLTFLTSGLAFYHGLQEMDVFGLTESGSYILITLYELMMVSTPKLNRKHINFFLESLYKDFEIMCTKNLQYRKQFFEYQLSTWQICVYLSLFIAFASFAVVAFSFLLLIYYLATHAPGDRAERPLQFGLWVFDIDLHKTPYYEMMFIYTDYTILLYTYTYMYTAQLQLVWIRQIACKAHFIIYSLEHLLVDYKTPNSKEEKEQYDNIIKLRLREIISEHQSMNELIDQFSAVFKKLFMYEQKGSAFIVALAAYGTLQALKTGEVQAALTAVCLVTITVAFIPGYFCTYLLIQLRNIVDACFDVPFWNAGPYLRPYLVLMIQRSLRPLPFQAAGFEEVSLKTFSAKMTSAYSMFNMLRRLDL